MLHDTSSFDTLNVFLPFTPKRQKPKKLSLFYMMKGAKIEKRRKQLQKQK
jgi:hypothetical protein